MIRTGNKNFWLAQTIGWTLMAGSILLVQLLAGYPKEILIYNSLAPMIVGFVLTSVYRYLIRNWDWRKWNLGKTLAFLLGSTFILTTVFMILVFAVFRVLHGPHGLKLSTFLGNMILFTSIILTWNLLYFTVHYFNNWTQAEIDKWKLTAEMKDAQLGSLKSQIKPHFVFNTINNIRSLILEDKEKARDMLVNFSDLFRYSLGNTEQSKVELKEELEIVKQYLELLSIQFEDKLRYRIQVDLSLETILLPPMMLQILVENAVKHGISQNAEGGSILIEVYQEGPQVNIKVVNSGNLDGSRDLDEQTGVGLENIRKRLDLIYEGRATLSISEADSNVHAVIKIPLS